MRWWRSALRFGVKWILGPILTIFAAAFVIYTALALSPGDPVSTILGAKASPEQRQALRERLGLNEPVLVQFWNWFVNALHGDFGFSFTFRQDVSSIIGPRLGTTATLVLLSMALILIFGIGLGIVGGVSKRFRPLVSTLVGFLISIPSFVAASFLIGVFAVGLGWFPTFGAGDPGLDRLWHLALPAIALAIGWVAYLAQISMSSITEERNKEHVTTAVGRGLPFGLVLRKHILRNAGIPVLTASGLTLAALVAGSIVVETAFAVDGIGSLLVKSVLSKDQPVVAAISLIIITVFVVMTTIVDILQVVLDPKLRERSRR